jgi:hypothetical protein
MSTFFLEGILCWNRQRRSASHHPINPLARRSVGVRGEDYLGSKPPRAQDEVSQPCDFENAQAMMPRLGQRVEDNAFHLYLWLDAL